MLLRRRPTAARAPSPTPLRLRVDGADVETAITDRSESLLSVLRRTGHTAPKLACGRGECGACTVLVGERTELACVTLAVRVEAEVTTAAGLGADDLRAAFADHVGFQCGFCTPGQIVRAEWILRSGKASTRAEITAALAGNICRCTGYVQIVDSVLAAQAARGQRGAS